MSGGRVVVCFFVVEGCYWGGVVFHDWGRRVVCYFDSVYVFCLECCSLWVVPICNGES